LPSATLRNQDNTITLADSKTSTKILSTATSKIKPVEEGKKEPDYSSPFRKGETRKPTSIQNVWPSQAPTLMPLLSSAAIRNQVDTITSADSKTSTKILSTATSKIKEEKEGEKEYDYSSPIRKGEKNKLTRIQNVWPSRAPTLRPSLSSAAIRYQGNTITSADSKTSTEILSTATSKIKEAEKVKNEPDYSSPIQGEKYKPTSIQNVWLSQAPTLGPSMSSAAVRNQDKTITFADSKTSTKILSKHSTYPARMPSQGSESAPTIDNKNHVIPELPSKPTNASTSGNKNSLIQKPTFSTSDKFKKIKNEELKQTAHTAHPTSWPSRGNVYAPTSAPTIKDKKYMIPSKPVPEPTRIISRKDSHDFSGLKDSNSIDFVFTSKEIQIDKPIETIKKGIVNEGSSKPVPEPTLIISRKDANGFSGLKNSNFIDSDVLTSKEIQIGRPIEANKKKNGNTGSFISPTSLSTQTKGLLSSPNMQNIAVKELNDNFQQNSPTHRNNEISSAQKHPKAKRSKKQSPQRKNIPTSAVSRVSSTNTHSPPPTKPTTVSQINKKASAPIQISNPPTGTNREKTYTGIETPIALPTRNPVVPLSFRPTIFPTSLPARVPSNKIETEKMVHSWPSRAPNEILKTEMKRTGPTTLASPVSMPPSVSISSSIPSSISISSSSKPSKVLEKKAKLSCTYEEDWEAGLTTSVLSFQYFVERNSAENRPISEVMTALEVEMAHNLARDILSCNQHLSNRKLKSVYDSIVAVHPAPKDTIAEGESCLPNDSVENECFVVNGYITIIYINFFDDDEENIKSLALESIQDIFARRDYDSKSGISNISLDEKSKQFDSYSQENKSPEIEDVTRGKSYFITIGAVTFVTLSSIVLGIGVSYYRHNKYRTKFLEIDIERPKNNPKLTEENFGQTIRNNPKLVRRGSSQVLRRAESSASSIASHKSFVREANFTDHIQVSKQRYTSPKVIAKSSQNVLRTSSVDTPQNTRKKTTTRRQHSLTLSLSSIPEISQLERDRAKVQQESKFQSERNARPTKQVGVNHHQNQQQQRVRERVRELRHVPSSSDHPKQPQPRENLIANFSRESLQKARKSSDNLTRAPDEKRNFDSRKNAARKSSDNLTRARRTPDERRNFDRINSAHSTSGRQDYPRQISKDSANKQARERVNPKTTRNTNSNPQTIRKTFGNPQPPKNTRDMNAHPRTTLNHRDSHHPSPKTPRNHCRSNSHHRDSHHPSPKTPRKHCRSNSNPNPPPPRTARNTKRKETRRGGTPSRRDRTPSGGRREMKRASSVASTTPSRDGRARRKAGMTPRKQDSGPLTQMYTVADSRSTADGEGFEVGHPLPHILTMQEVKQKEEI